MSLPSVQTVRDRIQRVATDEIRYCLMATYLWCARISEVVGSVCPRDNYGREIARGPRGSDCRLNTYLVRDHEIPVVVFTIKTAKRMGRERFVALPLDSEYEPWASQLYGYFQAHVREESPIFLFTRQFVWDYVENSGTFADLTYPIEKYVWRKKTLEKVTMPQHNRKFALHALRHLRASELVGDYGFDGFNLATYGGWTCKTMAQTSSTMERYLTLSWQSYFPKLLKRRT